VFFSAISGDRKLPTCATRDIAVIAARLLIDRSWSGHFAAGVFAPTARVGCGLQQLAGA
jgi:hypothetical protein